MSSEAITRNDLTAILNEVLPTNVDGRTVAWTSEGDVYWWANSWTCPADGFIEVYVEPSASTWYYRISDSTMPDTGWSHRMSGSNANSTSHTFFVKKGAVLQTHSASGINAIHIYYFKFKIMDASSTDYIVEQGTSGIWTYRKWNSGIAECWGTTSGTYTISSTYGNLYYANGSVTYPSGLFTAVDNVSVCRSPSNTGGLIFFSAYGTLSTSTLAYYISSGRAESGLVIDISHYVIGRWK